MACMVFCSDQLGGGQRLFEVAHNLIALGGRGVDGRQVVVVRVYAPGAGLGQQLHQRRRREWVAHRQAEWIAAGVAYGPQAKAEFVLWTRFKAVNRVASLLRTGESVDAPPPADRAV